MGQRVGTARERIEMVRQHEQGVSLKQIAEQVGLNWYTVRHWWRRYRDGGVAALQPRPTQRTVRGTLSQFHPLVRYVLLRLKRQYPHWGPDLLLYVMRQRPSLNGIALPSRTSVAVYARPYLWRCRQHRLYPSGAHQQRIGDRQQFMNNGKWTSRRLRWLAAVAGSYPFWSQKD